MKCKWKIPLVLFYLPLQPPEVIVKFFNSYQEGHHFGVYSSRERETFTGPTSVLHRQYDPRTVDAQSDVTQKCCHTVLMPNCLFNLNFVPNHDQYLGAWQLLNKFEPY